MTKNELFKQITKDYIDLLKRDSIIEDRYTGKFRIFIDMSNGGIGNINVDREVGEVICTYSTLAKTVKVKEKLFWEGTD